MNHITVKEFYNDNKNKFHLRMLSGQDYFSKKKIIVSDINRPDKAAVIATIEEEERTKQ